MISYYFFGNLVTMCRQPQLFPTKTKETSHHQTDEDGGAAQHGTIRIPEQKSQSRTGKSTCSPRPKIRLSPKQELGGEQNLGDRN